MQINYTPMLKLTKREVTK